MAVSLHADPTGRVCHAPQSPNILYVTLPIPYMSLGTPHYHLSFSGFHPPHLQPPQTPLLTCGKTARPSALSFPMFLFFLSAPLPDAFWLLGPELRAQLSIICLTSRRQSSTIQFKESKNKTEQKRKNIPKIFEIDSACTVRTGECWVCKISPTILERTLQSSCISYIRNICNFVMNWALSSHRH